MWLQVTSDERRMVKIQGKATSWCKKSLLTRSFHDWIHDTSEHRRLRRGADKALMHWRKGFLASSFSKWEACAVDQRETRVKRLAGKFVKGLVNGELLASWEGWKAAFVKLQRLKRAGQKVVQRMQKRSVILSWLAWLEIAKLE
jgi:hypothetical protein